MRLPVDEKNFRIMQTSIDLGLSVVEKIALFTPLSIYRAYFTNVRAM
jgi:hypothetical protein